MGRVAELKGGAAEVFEAAIDRLRWPLLVPGRVEEGQHVRCLLGQFSAELGQLGQGIRPLLAKRPDQLLRRGFGLRPVGFSVGGDHGLVDLPGHLDRDVFLALEQRTEALALTIG